MTTGGLGWRRRCAWCGVQLRQWQLNLCATCKPKATGDAGIYLQSGGPPCPEASRWKAEPDQSKLAARLRRWYWEYPVEVAVWIWVGLMVCIAAAIVVAGFAFG